MIKCNNDINNDNYNRAEMTRKNSYQGSKNKVIENYSLLKIDSNRSILSAQKNCKNDTYSKENAALNNSRNSNSSQKGTKHYLDRRHYEAVERLNKLRVEKLMNEESELKEKPLISRNSQRICERLAGKNQGNSILNGKVKPDNYSRDLESTINNMKKELYDTAEKRQIKQTINKENYSGNNTHNSYNENKLIVYNSER